MENLKKFYIDIPVWHEPIKVDDFLVAVGKNKSNSVYHIAEVKTNPKPEKRITRYHVKVFKSDLITCLKRENNQRLIPLTWYPRNKKSK